ncbi:hypothetical protein XENOCAPTIV_004678, partial [Xenoophorus captivus]
MAAEWKSDHCKRWSTNHRCSAHNAAPQKSRGNLEAHRPGPFIWESVDPGNCIEMRGGLSKSRVVTENSCNGKVGIVGNNRFINCSQNNYPNRAVKVTNGAIRTGESMALPSNQLNVCIV